MTNSQTTTALLVYSPSMKCVSHFPFDFRIENLMSSELVICTKVTTTTRNKGFPLSPVIPLHTQGLLFNYSKIYTEHSQTSFKSLFNNIREDILKVQVQG